MKKLFCSLVLCSAVLFLSACDKKEKVSENSESVPEVTSVQNTTDISSETVSSQSTCEKRTSDAEGNSNSENDDEISDDNGELIIVNGNQDLQDQNTVSENSKENKEEKSDIENVTSESDDGVIVLPFIPFD